VRRTIHCSRPPPEETGSAAGLLNAVQRLGAAALDVVYLTTATGPVAVAAGLQHALRPAAVLLTATAAAAAALMTPREWPALP
jgi:hypothetical protein